MAKLAGYGTLALITMILGYWGLTDYLHGGYSPFDIAYQDLQLFVVSSDALRDGGPVPVPLQIARFAAPAVTSASIISAVYATLDSRRRDLHIRRASGHVVVCGGDRKAFLLAARLRMEKSTVVLVRPRVDADVAAECRAAGLLVVEGEPSSVETLRRAALPRAKALYVVTPDNAANVAITVLAHRLGSGRRRPLVCYVAVDDPGLIATLTARFLSAPMRAGIDLSLFSETEIAAHVLLDRHAPSGVPQKVAVIGLNALGQALTLELARRWQEQFRLTGEPLVLILVDEEAPRIWDLLRSRHEILRDACQVDFVTVPAEHLRASPASELLRSPAWRPPALALVSTGDADGALAVGLGVRGICRDTLVAVCVDEHGEELNEVLNDLVGGVAGALSVFGVQEAVCEPDFIRDGVATERLARSLHGRYLQTCLMQGETSADNPALRIWERLPERIRELNRSQARHIGSKLNAIDCFLLPFVEDGSSPAFMLSPAEIEELARAEHTRWMKERTSAGYVHGARRTRRAHPDMVAWERLSEPAREKDRAFVRAIPDIVADIGFHVARTHE